MPTTTYRYLIADLLTNEIIAELPFTGVSFTQQLNQAGTFTGHLLLSGINTYEYNVDASTQPSRNALYVDRNGILVWGGIIWNRTYSSQSQTLQITAREFESYFEKRLISTTVAYNNTDQLQIVRNLINQAQSTTSGNIGVIVGSETSGVLIDRVYYAYELKQVYQAIQDLSRQDDGFDVNISVDYDPVTNEPLKTLVLGYPRTGNIDSGVGDIQTPVFNLPAGNIVEYEYPEDGSITVNTLYVIGAGSNEGKLTSLAIDSTSIIDGFPTLEGQANYSDITDQAVLDNLALGQVLALATPPPIIKIVVPAYIDPEFGSYDIGDDARLIITDPRFPEGFDEIYRIVGFNVEPGENGPERVTITLTNTTN
jgi:hypothetical protein